MLGNRYSQHSFAQIPDMRMARSKFDRSFTIKDTFDFDDLVPFFCDEVIPGDTKNISVNLFARLTTQVVPVMDNMYLDFFFFFVPNRLVFDNWQKLMGERKNPGDSTDYVCPKMLSPDSTGFEIGSLYDKFGLPTGVPKLEIGNTLPFRAYYLIYNEWFRSENLQGSLTVPTGDGPDTPAMFEIQKSNKAHDYFTSGLPWPQKGPAVELPLGLSAPVVSDGTIQRVAAPLSYRLQGETIYGRNFAANTVGLPSANVYITGSTPGTNTSIEGTASVEIPTTETASYLSVDLSSATAATINQLREAFMMQSLLELDARGGTRYVEILRAHYNVVSPDFRLQRPEYLGGGRTKINVHPVPQTSSTSEETPQGNLAAFATASSFDRSIGFTKSFVEHGYVLGLVRARADLTYQQGLNRMWSKRTCWDFFWPKLQELGEQATLNKEIYAQGNDVLSGGKIVDNLVHSYQERYAEYRYYPSQIRGLFRSQAANSLDVWHLAEDFESLPPLNSQFIKSNTPIERLLAVEGENDLLIDYWVKYFDARPMTTYSVPATIGRF